MNRFRERYYELLEEKFVLLEMMKFYSMKKYAEKRLQLVCFKLIWCDVAATELGKKEESQKNRLKKIA